jgi:hypothetical protein
LLSDDVTGQIEVNASAKMLHRPEQRRMFSNDYSASSSGGG